MSPTMDPSNGHSDSPTTMEEMKAFLHARNKTGVIGDAQWHDDIKVHELWDKLSVPESSGKCLCSIDSN